MRHPATPYVAPMAVFLALMYLGPRLGLGVWEYPLRAVILAAVLWLFSRTVIDFEIRSWPGSVAIGLAVFALWVAPDQIWPQYRLHWLFSNPLTGAVPLGADPALVNSPLALASRALRAAVLVPIVEELFWRAWLMRWLIRRDFTSIPLGSYTREAFWLSAALFAAEHGSFWDVGLMAGVVYNYWMVRRKSLGDCILAHGVTNAALSAWVLVSGQWRYWP